MEIGYARVSTIDQNPALQLDALKKAGCEKIYKDEGISGSTMKRPGLQRCLKSLEDGDRLTVWKLDRLARSLRDLVAMIEDFDKRGIQFRSLTEQLDTSTPGGKLIFHIFAALAEFEKALIVERTREGLKAARARGVRTGPKPKLTHQQIKHAQRLIDEGQYREQVADLFKVSRVTLYRALAAHGRASEGHRAGSCGKVRNWGGRPLNLGGRISVGGGTDFGHRLSDAGGAPHGRVAEGDGSQRNAGASQK